MYWMGIGWLAIGERVRAKTSAVLGGPRPSEVRMARACSLNRHGEALARAPGRHARLPHGPRPLRLVLGLLVVVALVLAATLMPAVALAEEGDGGAESGDTSGTEGTEGTEGPRRRRRRRRRRRPRQRRGSWPRRRPWCQHRPWRQHRRPLGSGGLYRSRGCGSDPARWHPAGSRVHPIRPPWSPQQGDHTRRGHDARDRRLVCRARWQHRGAWPARVRRVSALRALRRLGRVLLSRCWSAPGRRR